MRTLLSTLILIFGISTVAFAEAEYDIQAIQGYDPVAYFTKGEAVRGNGNNALVHEGRTYLFSSREHKKLFKENPERYLPQYGGWCAFGVSKGKKFASDATAWSIVDGKLYLNLNKKVQNIWKEDPNARIKEANTEWKTIHNKASSAL